MKRVRCPKCDEYIIFDETKYQDGQQLVFECAQCGKQFGIRMGVSKIRKAQKDENPDELANEHGYGSIVVIENVFHYKQVLAPGRQCHRQIHEREQDQYPHRNQRPQHRHQPLHHQCVKRQAWQAQVCLA